jgi:hypothetical protein
MKKAISSFVLAGLIVSSLSSVSASAQSVTVNDATYQPVPESINNLVVPFVEPKYPGPGTFYDPLTTSSTKISHFSLRTTNSGNITQQITRTVSLRKYAQITVGGQFELKILATKVNTTVEVQAGIDKTVSTSITWNVPAKSVYDLNAGEEVVKTTGFLEVANTSGVVTSSKAVTGEWTTREYSDGIFVKNL